MNEVNKINRRKMIRGIGIGLTALAVSPAFAAPEHDNAVTLDAAPEDPRFKYPRPPFKSQSQPWPGLAGKMEPRPDHGEKSYKGSGRLAGRKALITGATRVWDVLLPLRMHVKEQMSRSTIFPPKSPMHRK